MLTIHFQHSIVFFYFKLAVYLFGVIRVRHIIKDSQNFVCKVSAYKTYHEPVQDKYLNGYTRIIFFFFSTHKLIHADEINKIY